MTDWLESFREWATLEVADGNASTTTLRSYVSDMRQHLEWLTDQALDPSTCTLDTLKGYRSWLVQQKYTVGTVARKLVSIRRFYEIANANGAIVSNPGARLRSPADHTNPAERIKYVAFDDLKRLLTLPTHLHGETARGHRDRAILVCMAIHGLRTVEVHRLNVGDVDWSGSLYGALRVYGKGNKWRTVLLTEETHLVLSAWIADRDCLDASDEGLFITLYHGVQPDKRPYHRVSRRSVRVVVDQYLVTAGVKRPKVSCHALRHSFATHALSNGARLIDISNALGHCNVIMTQRYAHVVDREKNNPSNALGGLFGGNVGA